MFKNLKIYYLFVSLPFILLLLGSALFSDAIKSTITRNPHPQINYAIFVIILVGGILIILNAKRLIREARALVEFSGAIKSKADSASLQKMANAHQGDLACIMQMVATSCDRSISHQEQAALEHELVNARSRLTRRNALPQYLTGLLVGMGLLGTFIGLLATLNDISTLISSFADLDMNNVNPIQVFRIMIERMKAPMQSMGIAFSASMFGLLGSIILGLMMVGMRRLQGDIFSLLSSEIARHIETALAFESISIRIPDIPNSDFSTKILLRIEERLAETARVRQRALSAEIDDFKKQRADMLHALTEQTAANNSFRAEMQQLVVQLGAIASQMERGNGAISAQLSELTIQTVGEAKESRKLLAAQIEEQKKLIGTLAALDIEDKLTEAVKLQQRALVAELEEFRKQRTDLLRSIGEQTDANNRFQSELQQMNSKFVALLDGMEQGRSKLATGLSEMGAQLNGSFRESHQLLAQQIAGQQRLNETVGSYRIEERLAETTRHQQRVLATELEDLQKQRADMLRVLMEQTEANNHFRAELQQLIRQLGTIAGILEHGNTETSSQISDLMVHMGANAKESHKLLSLLLNEQQRNREVFGESLTAG